MIRALRAIKCRSRDALFVRARVYADTKQTNNRRPSPTFVRRRRWWNRPPSRSGADKSRHCEEPSDEAIQGRRRRAWIASSQTLLAMTNRKAERRQTLFINLRISRCGATRLISLRGSEGRSPVGVPPRHLRQRPNATAQLQPRDFLGRGRRARPDGSKDARVATHRPEQPGPLRHRGRYPRLPVPVQRDCTRGPVMMPSGRVLPKPPGSTGDEPMPAGTAPAPPSGGPPDGVLVGERDWRQCN